VGERAASWGFALLVALSTPGREEPIAATIAELQSYPDRFHGREVAVRGELDPSRHFSETQVLRDKAYSIALVLPPQTPDLASLLMSLLMKRVEVRGVFFDHLVQHDSESWKRHGRFVIVATDLVEARDEPGASPEPVGEPTPNRGRGDPPPEIVSTVPAAGRRDIPPDTSFKIRFSADMDASTFEGNVRLGIGDIGNEQKSLFPATLAYDQETRTLTLSPKELLPPLKEVSLTLYEGITGADAVPLRVARAAPKALQSRRSAIRQGVNLRELIVFVFVTRGYDR
jgi:hypothetical protein